MPSHIPPCHAILLVTALGACGAPRLETDGKSDSAGVTIVHNPAPPASDSAPWTLVEGMRISGEDGAGALRFGQLSGLVLDPAGNIYSIDPDRRVILKFSPEGALLRTFAGPGAGPGEIGPGLVSLLAADDGRIVVVDPANDRLHSYDSSGTHLTDQPIDPAIVGEPVAWGIAPGGRVLMQVKQVMRQGDSMPAAISRILRFEAPNDTLVTIRGGLVIDRRAGLMEMQTVLFAAEPPWTTIAGGRIVVGDPERFGYREYTADGELAREVTLEHERRRVTDEDRQAVVALIREAFGKQFAARGASAAPLIERLVANFSFAEFYPALATILPGPFQTIMIQRFATVPEMRQGAALGMDATQRGSSTWELFSAAGQHLGAVRFPATFRPFATHSSAIWGIDTDEFGVESMVRFDVKARR
jgi:hypothetical protein